MRYYTLFLVTIVLFGASINGCDKSRPPTDVLKARCFQLVDAKGTIRGEFAVRDNGSVRLDLRDEQGKTCSVWNVSQSRSSIRSNAVLVTASDGRPRMTLLAADQGGVLTLADLKGKLRAQLTIDSKGPRLYLCDEKENARLQLSVDDPGPFSPAPGADIFLSSKEGKRVHIWQGTTAGFDLCDRKGRTRMIIEATDKGPRLIGYEADGRTPQFAFPR